MNKNKIFHVLFRSAILSIVIWIVTAVDFYCLVSPYTMVSQILHTVPFTVGFDEGYSTLFYLYYFIGIFAVSSMVFTVWLLIKLSFKTK